MNSAYPRNITRNARRFLFILVALFGVNSGHAATEENRYGLLLLFTDNNSSNNVPAAIPTKLTDCTLWRQGTVSSARGPLHIGSPNQFAVFSCTKPVVSDIERRTTLASLFTNAPHISVLEGPMERQHNVAENRSTRAYVIKVSHYNNVDPNGRDIDLAKINGAAARYPDSWSNEAVISVQSAIGMARPDDVTILYYDSAQQAVRFRKNAPAILKRIGAFNRRHLVSFTYVSGTAGP
ncbi:MAG: hypothetical protein GKS00_06640 [Alphaproteobacteria bacterium]|nr:hypothetical protein [Alphaproteobacteria bacterium]